MPEVPVKLYIDKLLKTCRSNVSRLALLPGPVKDGALRAMADRLVRDEEAILSANEQDVDALGKSFGSEVNKDRLKAAVARVRLVAADVKEMAERLRFIADRPDPVGAVTGRWERPDGLVVSRVRVPIGVIGIISELKPLVTVESIALGLPRGDDDLRLLVDRTLSRFYPTAEFAQVYTEAFGEPDERTLLFFQMSALPE